MQIQSTPVNTDTEVGKESVCINGMSVLGGLHGKENVLRALFLQGKSRGLTVLQKIKKNQNSQLTIFFIFLCNCKMVARFLSTFKPFFETS